MKDTIIKRILNGEDAEELANEYVKEMLTFTVNNPELAQEHYPDFYQMTIETVKTFDAVELANLIQSIPSSFPTYKRNVEEAIGDTQTILIDRYIELYDVYLELCKREDYHPIILAACKSVATELEQHRQYFIEQQQRVSAPTVSVPLAQLSIWWKQKNASFGGCSAGTFDGLWLWVERQGERLKNAQGNHIKHESLRVKYNGTVKGEECDTRYADLLDKLYNFQQVRN
ncbi:MAG: hypothetical protein H3C37_00970 [Candidatus Kapabacteria bacterium]|nr:MAG: hypothetical protein UZ22_OP11002000857 [Microgenomates bacterium OLB23]MBW7852806.1 hypothetical protein [Candidatus Kapabacteria bacterium]